MSDRSILVVGGTGMIGSHIARRLADRGDRVSIMSRSPASADDPAAIAGIPRLVGDYSEGAEPRALEGFSDIVFAAGQDIRHIGVDVQDEAIWDRMQRVGVPAFAAGAKARGVKRFVQLGSYYHHLRPEFAETMPYVAARRDADARTRGLSDAGFAAMTLNPPSIVGTSGGRGLRGFARLIAWVRGELPTPPLSAPPGGTNYMSVRSLTQATLGALDRGAAGTAYLVGDENLTYQQYFQALATAAGSELVVDETDEDHPFQPDRFIVQGRGRVIAYEPDPAEVALLGYDRRDVARALSEIVHRVDAAAR
ncbi:NAD-dependent epimerase/dehydratase family protein [uncultured Microbacterium sp.]|uniref:NAD-dependent epimerase/dehydratase family protein n=1 Tax=uncultured Microbacterium sp. TaxID=191216 RepID=UPI0035CB775D